MRNKVLKRLLTVAETNGWEILAWKSRSEWQWWVMIRRDHSYHEYVVATVSEQTLRYNEWHAGTYHDCPLKARDDFDGRRAIHQCAA